MTKKQLQAALERIAGTTKGFDAFSSMGLVNMIARDALGQPLDERERRIFDDINSARAERLAREAKAAS